MESPTAAVPRDGLWSEDGDRVWLPIDYADSPTRVKRKAFRGDDLPVSPAREFSGCYRDIAVRQVVIRPGYPWEEGWAGKGADTWWRTPSSRDENAVIAWEVSFV